MSTLLSLIVSARVIISPGCFSDAGQELSLVIRLHTMILLIEKSRGVSVGARENFQVELRVGCGYLVGQVSVVWVFGRLVFSSFRCSDIILLYFWTSRLRADLFVYICGECCVSLRVQAKFLFIPRACYLTIRAVDKI